MRKKYLDIIRLIAIAMVIYDYTEAYGLYRNYDVTQPVSNILLVIFIAAISKVNVPLFLMVSGAAILGKDYSYKKVFDKLARFVLVLIIFEAILYMKNGIYEIESGATTGVLGFITGVTRGVVSQAYSYWYIYIHI